MVYVYTGVSTPVNSCLPHVLHNCKKLRFAFILHIICLVLYMYILFECVYVNL